MDIIRNLLSTEDYSKLFTNEEKEEGRIYSIIGYFWFLFFIPLLVKNNKYCKYHANQGLNLLIFSLLGGLFVTLLDNFLKMVSLGVVSIIFKVVFSLIVVFLFCFGIFNSLKGKARNLPLIGEFRLIK